MCCCYVDQCCCGCSSHKAGVIAWAIIDLIVNLVFFSGFAVLGGGAAFIWGLFIIIADICLIFGASKSNPCLMLFWMVVSMINIVLLFIALLGVIVLVILGAAILGSLFSINQACKEWAQSDENFDTSDCGNGDTAVAGGAVILAATGLYIVVMAILYIYFWVVVSSLRKKVIESGSSILPVMAQQPVFVMAPQPPGYVPQQPIAQPLQVYPAYQEEKY